MGHVGYVDVCLISKVAQKNMPVDTEKKTDHFRNLISELFFGKPTPPFKNETSKEKRLFHACKHSEGIIVIR